jgi:hypothetical protein
MATGQCLCGAVRHRVQGPLGDVLICHCEDCRRWHGHVSATRAVERDNLPLLDRRCLRWIRSPRSDAQARRGFWAECGSSLFSDARATRDQHRRRDARPPTGLRVASHWFVSQAGDYYELPEDGLLRQERSGEGELPDVPATPVLSRTPLPTKPARHAAARFGAKPVFATLARGLLPHADARSRDHSRWREGTSRR